MRHLAFAREAKDFLESLDAKQFRQVGRKCLSLIDNPRPNDSIRLKASEYYRTDIGEYRIVYLFDEDVVSIDRIGKRNDDEVYK